MIYAKKIKDITLREASSKGYTSWDKIHINEKGNLHFDSYELGFWAEQFFGQEDHEDDTFVDAEWKDTILLLLLKERFKTNSEFDKWADEQQIPYTGACR